MVLLHVLFEHAAGYALFAVKEVEEIGMLLPQVEESLQNIGKFNSIVKLVAFSPFKSAQSALENVNAISEGVLHEDLKLLLETHMPAKKKKALLGVSDGKIGAAIFEELHIKCDTTGVVPELMRGIRLHFHSLVKGLTAQSASKAQLGLGHSYSRAKVKFNVNRVDNMIIQSISLLDQLDKDINTFSMRVREWYGYHFPELIKIVSDNYTYCRMAKFIGNRKELSEEKLEEMEEIIMDSAKAQAILDASRSSMGMDISPIDLINIESFSSRVISLSEYRKGLQEYLRSKMTQVAPSLSALIGEVVGARLISHAGSLTNLAKYPASTVQILGAEKALFRALKTRGNTPKYGLIFHSTFIGRAAAKNKGRISRYLANKCTIASRIDCFSEIPTSVYGDKLREQVEERLAFYETGEAPRKNLDVMKEAQAEATEVVSEIRRKLEKKERKRKKREKKRLAELEQEESAAAQNTEEVEEKPKKKKNKPEVVEEELDSQEEEQDNHEEPSSKKKKKKLEVAEVSDNEKAASSKKKKKRKSDAEVSANMAAPARNHVWVGTETGILKGIDLVKKQAINYTEVSSLDRGQEVNVLCFGDPQESEVLLGSQDGVVKVFNCEKSKFTEFHECRGGEGVFRGLGVVDNGIITCVDSGLMKVWKEGSENLEVQVGPGVAKMRQCDVQRNKVGTGGKEHDLKIWDLQRAEEPIFKAKNVRNDWLDLRVPVWIRDLDFIPETDKIVTCTSYHQVRVYDPNTPQRRPVLEALFGEDPLTALSITPDGRSVVVGNSHGNMGVIDLRKGRLLCSLKGGAGSVRSIQCHKSMPVVASCGLDRFMRLHSINDKQLLHKVYLKSRLNCLLLTSRDKWEEEELAPLPTEDVKDEEDDEVWDNMEPVLEKTSSRKQGGKRGSTVEDIAIANTLTKKKKKKV